MIDCMTPDELRDRHYDVSQRRHRDGRRIIVTWQAWGAIGEPPIGEPCADEAEAWDVCRGHLLEAEENYDVPSGPVMYRGTEGCTHLHYLPGVTPSGCAHCAGNE